MKVSDQAGIYAAQLHVAETHSRPWLWVVAVGWIVCPFLVRTVLMNPGDMIWAQYVAQGLSLPSHGFTAQQTAVGFVEAVVALAVLLLLEFCATVMFYRRAALDLGPVATPTLWPLAALLPGVLGNAAWLAWSGSFDLAGCLIGGSSAYLTVGVEIIINRLGKDFVYGKKNQLVQLQSQ
ncbi:MAG TPA: hypothetical protein VNF04_02750 [Stellaceae bacterium]|nr:hypothetical protein [Stellaceae bacterium]